LNERVTPVGDLPLHGAVTVDLPVPGSALAVGAHPDDIEFGCGATLAKWAGGGCRLHHLVLTDGSKGTWVPEQDPAALAERRRAEQIEAATRLGGGDVVFLGFPDGELQSGVAERRAVCEVIRRFRPEVVLGHDPWRRYRLHPDHRHAGWLVAEAVVAAREPGFFPDLGPPHRPSALLLWEADEPNHVEEAAAGFEAKLAALLAHRSQYRTTLGIEEDEAAEGEHAGGGAEGLRRRLEAQLGAHGRLAGLVHPARGEAFRLITDL
jgi:LmbE family N-acetylglucosaminyl deacetylase